MLTENLKVLNMATNSLGHLQQILFVNIIFISRFYYFI